MYLIQTVSSGPVSRRTTGMVEETVETPNDGRKKWSIGKLFRRKKKETDSEASSASSDECSQKNNVKRKKTNKKRHSTPRTNDHAQSKRSQSVTKVVHKEYQDEGVLSDPSAGFIGYVGRGIPRSPLDMYKQRGQDSLEKRGAGSSCGSQDGSLRKGRKGRIKARAEAKRIFKNESSSDEESQKSTSSSVLRFRSDDSLANHSKEGSVSKRSRSARNDRYIKRLSRDDESQFTTGPELTQQGYSRSEAEILALKQRVLSTPQISSSYGRINKEPDYSEPLKNGLPYDTKKSFSGTQLSTYANCLNNGPDERLYRRQPGLSTSNSSVYSYPAGVINFNAQVNDENVSYCVPYNVNRYSGADITTRQNFRRSTSIDHNESHYVSPNYENDVMVIKLPLGVPRKENVAPPPPPRDPQRKVSTPLSYMYDNVRPLSGSYDFQTQRISKSIPTNSQNGNIYENGAVKSRQVNGLSWSKRPISSSEDHIAIQKNYISAPQINQNIELQRPSSVSGEMRPDIYNRYINRPQVNQVVQPRRHTQENTVNPEFVYFADRTPRSRRPIHIAPTTGEKEQIYANEVRSTVSQPRNASDFWKRLDTQECQRRNQLGHNRTLSDQSVGGNIIDRKMQQTVPTPVRMQNASVQTTVVNGSMGNSSRVIGNKNGPVKNCVNIKKANKENEPVCYSNIDIIPMDDIRAKSRSSEDSSNKRKSTNLEDALSELEAIYNSLGLGDEDLLDRAERQELLAPKGNNNYFRHSTNQNLVDIQKRHSLSEKKLSAPDKLHDDMAYRRLNPHERPKSKDVSNMVPQVSYMLASPMLNEPIFNNQNVTEDEPDIVYDDVAYRNIKQANNYLKIDDPQPPFGIPIGPISPATNSDYLHVVPENKNRSRFIPHQSPDIVADDLAFRALRKDCKAVSPINREITGSIHNTNSDNANLSRPSKIFDNHVIKKKRAIRSLSANIFTLIQKEIDDALGMCSENGLEKSQSIPDLPDAVVEYGKSGKLPDSIKMYKSTNPPKIVDSLTKNKPGTKSEPSGNPSSKVNEERRIKFFNSPTVSSPPESLRMNEKFSVSNYPEFQSNFSKVKDDLDLMAEEAKETSAKLVIALEELQKDRILNQIENDKKRDFETKLQIKASSEDYNKLALKEESVQKEIKISQNAAKDMESETNSKKDIPKKINLSAHILNNPSNIKVKGTIPTHIKEKMEEFSRPRRDSDNSTTNVLKDRVLENSSNNSDCNIRSKGEHTEDSLIAISNQLNIVGSALKSNVEPKIDILSEEGVKLKELAERCAVTIKDKNEAVKTSPEKRKENESLVKAVNANNEVHSLNNNKNDCLSPESKRSYMNEIESLNDFDDLRKGISELLDGIGKVSGKFSIPKESDFDNDIIKLPSSIPSMNSNLKKESIQSGQSSTKILDDDRRDSRESPEYNSSEELAMIFHLNEDPSKPCTSKQDLRKIDESHAELSSPRLVQNASQSLRKMSLDEGTQQAKKSSQNETSENAGPVTEVPWRKYRRNSTTDNVNKGNVLNYLDHRSGGGKRSQEEIDLSQYSNLSAFQPVKPRRLITETPCAKSKVLKERPFFEDIRIIARGFGEIIEYPNRRGCVDRNDACQSPNKSPIADNGYFRRVRLSQDLTKAANRKGGVWKARRRIERRATTQGVECENCEETKKEVDNIKLTKRNSINETASETLNRDLNIPQASSGSLYYSKSESTVNLGRNNKDILKNCSYNKLISTLPVEVEDKSCFSDSESFESEDFDMSSGMMEGDIGRTERMRKYKEERRKQLASQSQKYTSISQRSQNRRNPAPATADTLPPENGPTEHKTSSGPSTSLPVVRTTRASRLRAAATASADHAPTSKRHEKKGSEGRANASRSNFSSSVDSSTISPINTGDSSMSTSVTSSISDSLIVQSNERISSNLTSGGVNECIDINAVINVCESPSGKVIYTEEAKRENEGSRHPSATLTASCQKGHSSRQLSKPSSSSPVKDSSSDEISSRRGRIASSRQGNRSDSDSTKELSSAKCASLSASSPPSTTVTRRTPPRSLSSPRSSSQSPHNQQLQLKRRSVDLNTRLPVTISQSLKNNSAETISTHKPISNVLNSVNIKKIESKSSLLGKKSQSRELDLECKPIDSRNEEQIHINKRLNSITNDTRQNKNESNVVKLVKDPVKKSEKMAPGVESNVSLKFFPSSNLDKTLSHTSSISNPPSKIDKIRANNSRLSSRMDALAALTKETLARVDKLTKMSQDSQDKLKRETTPVSSANEVIQVDISKTDKSLDVCKPEVLPSCSTSSPSKQVSDRLSDIDKVTEHLLDFEKRNALGAFSKQNSSYKKSTEPSNPMPTNLLSYTPVSILKRKSLQEESNSLGLSSGAVPTPPVTFSPSVVDPIPSKSRGRSQGILKKRRSLDESHVHRRRSCSPEVAFADDYHLETRPILKTQRRSSLEEVIRGRSPDGHLHGILKRKTSRDSDHYSGDRSLGSPEPQGILKRKSNSSSSSSTTSSHVSIAQAVILAAAGGAELVEDKESVRPILKKKSFSEERQSFDNSSEGPKPILKKKSLTESDDNDHEKPKRPILKSSRKISLEDGNASSFDLSEDDRGSRRSSVLKHRTPENSECESTVRPILKHPSRDHSQSPRPRLSFCSDDERALLSMEESVGQHFINPSFSLLRRLEANNSQTSDDDDVPISSKFESGRLHSPSKLKEFHDDNDSNSTPHHPSVVLRRREERPKVVNRSKSLASNFGDELDTILRTRRHHVDEGIAHMSPPSTSNNSTEDKPYLTKFPSVAERIQCMKKYMGAGDGIPQYDQEEAVPIKRSAIGRYKTQPITVEELQNISSLELCQADFQPFTGQSSSSLTGPTDAKSITVDNRTDKSTITRPKEEDKQQPTDDSPTPSSPDPSSSCDNYKFKNYTASPGCDGKSFESYNLCDSKNSQRKLKSPDANKTFDRVTVSAGSPEYRPYHPSPDIHQSSDNSEISNQSFSGRPLDPLPTPSTPERNLTSDSVDNSFSGNFVPSPQCYNKYKKHFSEDKDKQSSRRSFGVRNNRTDSFDNSAQDSPTTAEFNLIFKETARPNFTNFDSLDYSNIDSNTTGDCISDTVNTSTRAESNIDLIDSFPETASTVDNKTDDTIPPTTTNKVERPTSLFDSREGKLPSDSREAALQELDKLEIELEDVRCALDADSCALSGPDADHWSLNVSIDSGVFNRMSSGDSGPLSAEDLSLPQDFLKKPDIVRDHQPPSLLCNKITSPPPIDLTINKFTDIDKSEDFTEPTTPVHIHKQPRMDVEYLQNKTKRTEMSPREDVNSTDLPPDDDKCDDPVDSPEQLFGLMKSNSVSARASMWQQLHQQANKSAVKPVLRHSRSRAKDGCPSVLERFKTQPVTMDEVIDASNNDLVALNQSKSSFNLSMEQDEDAKLDENDPAKLTLAEKMKLFGATVNHRPPVGATKKPRSPRFQTMPVIASLVDDAMAMNRQKQEDSVETDDIRSPKNKLIRLSLPGNTDDFNKENTKRNILTSCASFDAVPKDLPQPIKPIEEKKKDLGANFRQAQNKLAEQASKMLTTEMKGILKSKSGAVPLLPTGGDKVLRTSPQSGKKDDVLVSTRLPYSNGRHNESPRSLISKGESSEGLKDEGIDSSSEDEIASHSSGSSDSCSSSDSSDEYHSPAVSSIKDAPTEHLVRPSQLKSCRTESDVSRVLRENQRNENNEKGVRLPCMDEMRARKIMESRMLKINKENTSKLKEAAVKKPPMENKIEQLSNNSVKLKNIRNGNLPTSQSLDSSPAAPNTFIPKNGNFALNKRNEDTSVNNNVPHFLRKFVNPVSKSQSMHVFHPQLLKNVNNGKEEKQAGSGEGSGSDGDSSGGREVRRIINKRRQFRDSDEEFLLDYLTLSKNNGSVPQVSQEPPKTKEESEKDTTDATFGLRRSATQPMSAQTAPHRGSSIAERLAALQQSGNNEWRRRIEAFKISPEEEVPNVLNKNKFNETLNKQAEEKKKVDPVELSSEADINKIRSKLESSSLDWKKRVGQHDASLFTVAGRMALDSPLSNVPPSSPLAPALTAAEDKRTPQPNKFRSRKVDSGTPLNSGIMKSLSTAAVSQPASPKKPGVGDFKRSISVSGVDDMNTVSEQQGTENVMTKSEDGTLNGNKAGASVAIPRPDDETFTSFYTSALQSNNNDILQPVQDIDLDAIDSGSRQLLGRTAVARVRATRKTGGSSNHLKVLAARTDIKQEYTESATTGIAEMEVNRLKKDKVAQNSTMAVEALAGLASSEDFTAVNLKKTASSTALGGNGAERNTTKPLLIQVKGRRKVQVRLIEPVAECVNSGDCFVLVTTSQVFCYNGFYANIIERTRASDIALHIHNKKDLGCINSTSVIVLDEQHKHRTLKQWNQFWSLLGVEEIVEEYVATPTGSADEDEIYESEITSTNMCYEVMDDVFVPIKNFWGQTPKISMLDPSKIIVFDFGTELYVWNGKNTILENRRRAFQLAQELWDTGYNYTDCLINPINISHGVGGRKEFKEMPKTDSKRPDWAMIAKVTQHMETILFKDKFLDWPDFTRVIKVKEEEETFKGAAEIKSCNVDMMWNREYEDPSLVLEGSHVGRGTTHYDKETMRHFDVKTKSITKWMIQEYDYVKIPPEDLNEFYSADTYIIRWEYQITVTGRELNGKPSKHNVTGRDRCAYFYWQGKDASANEKGAAALLTVELDHEKGPQVRVTQSSESPAFLNMFNGHLVIHQGRKGDDKSKSRLYTVRGNIENESHLVQLSCSMRQLRSRASLIIVDIENGQVYVWHGCKSLKHTRSVALEAAKKLAARKHPDLFNSAIVDVKVSEMKEGEEPKSVIDALLGGNKKELYNSMLYKDVDLSQAVTTRLFHFTDLSSQFEAIEILSPLRHESYVTPFPFSQSEIYSASQPALFLLDSGDRLWLWQGWWPQQEETESTEAYTGSHRWQVCRRAAMETVLEYWKLSRPDKPKPEAYMAMAGLEPLAFTNLFDDWHNRDDVAEINIAQGYGVGVEEISVAEQLHQLCCTSFPLAVLRQRPLPESVDPAHIEKYLSDDDFQETFKMTKEEFSELPAWKQANIKKDLGLF